MQKPEIIDVVSLVGNPHGVSAEWTLGDGRKWWGPARGYGWNQLSPVGRFRAAWMVFFGRADALVWPSPPRPLVPRRNPRLHWIFRADEIQRHFRIAMIVWERGIVGNGKGYSAKFSIALSARPFRRWHRDATTDWMLTLFFIRLHYCRSYGGLFP